MENKSLPDAENVKAIIQHTFKETVDNIERFSMGNCHFVFDVITESQRNVVVRIAQPENKNLLENSIFWSDLLKPKGVPLVFFF